MRASFSLVLLTAAMTGDAYASEPAGGPALRQARAAWESRSFSKAEPLYREALEKGGLAPPEVLEGYVRLGAMRAARGKKAPAIAAFRAASVLDATFTVPSVGGARASRFAAQAKKDTAKVGSLQLSIVAPVEAPSGKSFVVVAELDRAHVAIVSKIGLFTRDGASGKESTAERDPSELVAFDVPAELAALNANLLVRVDALDKHGNRLASAEEHVRVSDTKAPSSPVAAVRPEIPIGPPVTTTPSAPARDTGRSVGFWSSPWPYVLGGVALAGAGTAVYFGTRPADEVSVGPIGVRTR